MTGPKAPIAVGTLVILSGATTAFAINLDQSIVILAIPSIGDALGASLSQVQWIVSGFLLPLAALLVVGGMISDRFGAGRVLVLGILLFVVGTVGSAVSTAAVALIVMRVVAGLGAALALPASVAAMRVHLSGSRLTFGLAMWFSGALAGSAVGPVVGGALLALGPWQLVFWTSAAIATIGVASAWFVASRSRSESGIEHLAVVPSLAGGVGLGALVWGLINAGERGWGDPRAILAITLGMAIVAAVAGYLRWTRDAEDQTGEFDARLLVGALGLMTASVFGIVGAVFFTIIYMQAVMGLSPFAAGLALLPFAGLAAALSPLAPRMLERFGIRRVLILAATAELVGLIGLSRVGVDTGYIGIGPFLALFGVAMSFMPTISLSLALAASPERRAGVVSGAQAASLQFGQLISIAVIGSLVAVGVGSAYRTEVAEFGVDVEVTSDLVQQVARGAFDDDDSEAPVGPEEHEVIARQAFVTGMRQGVTVALALTAAAFVALFFILRVRVDPRATEESAPPDE